MTAVGAWVRNIVMLDPWFYWVIFGQVIAGVGSPFLLNSAAKLANAWFGPKERVIATTLGAVSLQVGNGIAFKMPTFFFDDDKVTGDGAIKSRGREHMANYLWLWTGLITACTLITIIFFRDKPKTPPSKSASV